MSAAQRLVVGIDVGTQGTKAVAVDLDQGKLLARSLQRAPDVPRASGAPEVSGHD